MNKTLVFVFTGEFGYELLNWHARIQKLLLINPNVNYVVCSTKAVEALYPKTIKFIALDSLNYFQNGIADTYFIRRKGFKRDDLLDIFLAVLRRFQIKKYVNKKLSLKSSQIKFIFSDQFNVINDLNFGATRWAPRLFVFRKRHFDSIYDSLPYEENLYRKLIPSSEAIEWAKKSLEHLGKSQNFIVLQTADREFFLKKRRLQPESSHLIQILRENLSVVEIEFRPSRMTDTSTVSNNRQVVYCDNLDSQLAIISLAKFAIFFSDGDFRSLNYVPPFAGKNVYSITSSSIVSNSAINLWNEKVFKFGGSCIPLTLESFIWDIEFRENLINHFKYLLEK